MEKNLPLVLTKQLFLLSCVQTSGRFFQIFVDFSEKLNFSKVEFLCSFLGELKIPKRHFEINWPLASYDFPSFCLADNTLLCNFMKSFLLKLKAFFENTCWIDLIFVWNLYPVESALPNLQLWVYVLTNYDFPSFCLADNTFPCNFEKSLCGWEASGNFKWNRVTGQVTKW